MGHILSDFMSEDDCIVVLHRMYGISNSEAFSIMSDAAGLRGEWNNGSPVQVRVYIGHSSQKFFRIRHVSE